ncbi:hypothetical protein JYU34_019181 [Plutella xylostella]|uniref:Uncharacterized protein n=2 Tax=Plutella xylostella TaxID=51655 RepID=A0ABQ7PWF8_PLUXY|nr:hypothetical protein JYU34_019181 [Plutella xylostella]CAG9135554.1 unnamed protein product [Plutella xylostella]
MSRLVLFLFLIPLCRGQGEQEMMLNFDSDIEVCDDEDSQAFMDTKGIKTDRNETVAFVTGSIEFFKGMGANTMVEIKVFKVENGRSEMVFSYEICDLCAEIMDPESDYKKYLQYFGFPEVCPFAPGNYKIHDLTADTSELPINPANAGRYRIILTIFEDSDGSCKSDRTFLCCSQLEALIEPAGT